jgi:hypothetical protein
MSKQNNNVGYVKCDNVLTVFINNEQYVLDNTHVNYNLVLQELRGKKRANVIEKLVNVRRAIERFMRGRIKVDVDKGIVLYKNEVVEPVITNKIIKFMTDGLNARPLIKFLDNLMQNPSRRAINELYKFLEHRGLPLSKDGCFFAWKGVNENYLDIHSNKFLNKPGKKFSMPRNLVDDNWGIACSEGFHVGEFSYAKCFAGNYGRMMLVKVNPKDVVSVPSDCSCQKCRVCEYKVVKEYTEEQPVENAVYTVEEPSYED